eukprot:ANDGO_00756.mRNA.1 hypothetical protein
MGRQGLWIDAVVILLFVLASTNCRAVLARDAFVVHEYIDLPASDVGGLPSAMDIAHHRAYFPMKDSQPGRLVVFDTQSNSRVGLVKLDGVPNSNVTLPVAATVDSTTDATTLYVLAKCDYGQCVVRIPVNQGLDVPIPDQVLQLRVVSGYPLGLLMDPNGRWLYVTGYSQYVRVDLLTFTEDQYNLVYFDPGFIFPGGAAISSDGSQSFLGTGAGLLVVNNKFFNITKVVPVPGLIMSVCVDSTDTYALVSSQVAIAGRPQTVSRIRTSNLTIVDSINLPGSWLESMVGVGGYVYGSDRSALLQILVPQEDSKPMTISKSYAYPSLRIFSPLGFFVSDGHSLFGIAPVPQDSFLSSFWNLPVPAFEPSQMTFARAFSDGLSVNPYGSALCNAYDAVNQAYFFFALYQATASMQSLSKSVIGSVDMEQKQLSGITILDAASVVSQISMCWMTVNARDSMLYLGIVNTTGFHLLSFQYESGGRNVQLVANLTHSLYPVDVVFDKKGTQALVYGGNPATLCRVLLGPSAITSAGCLPNPVSTGRAAISGLAISANGSVAAYYDQTAHRLLKISIPAAQSGGPMTVDAVSIAMPWIADPGTIGSGVLTVNDTMYQFNTDPGGSGSYECFDLRSMTWLGNTGYLFAYGKILLTDAREKYIVTSTSTLSLEYTFGGQVRGSFSSSPVHALVTSYAWINDGSDQTTPLSLVVLRGSATLSVAVVEFRPLETFELFS